MNFDKYLWSVRKKGIVKLATIQTSRGCPYKCVFCTQAWTFSNSLRFRDPILVVDEIEEIVKNTPATHIVFIDDTIAIKKIPFKGDMQ